jgi:hypothetical protein
MRSTIATPRRVLARRGVARQYGATIPRRKRKQSIVSRATRAIQLPSRNGTATVENLAKLVEHHTRVISMAWVKLLA